MNGRSVHGITHYERIGVAPGASREEIRAAYRRLARRHHPDARSGDSTEMAALNEAWRVLGDPARRAAYDASLRAAPTPTPSRTVFVPEADVDLGDEPIAGHHRGGIPLPVLLLLALFGMIFVITAYAYTKSGSIDGPPPTTPVDGVLEVGSCVRIGADAVAAETPCAARRDGVVVAFIARDGRCPTSTEGYRDPASDGYVCIHR